MMQNATRSSSTAESPGGFERYAISILKDLGYRITTPRVEVIRTLARTRKALNAYSIHSDIIGSGGKIDVVSVYRILATLQEAKLVYHLGAVDGYYPRLSTSGDVLITINETTGLINVIQIEEEIIASLRRAAESKGLNPLTLQIESIVRATI